MAKYYLQHLIFPDSDELLFGGRVREDLHPLCFCRTQKLAIRDAKSRIFELDISEYDEIRLLDAKMTEVYRFQ